MSARGAPGELLLASIFGLRLFGMFIILPVFALYAERLPGVGPHARGHRAGGLRAHAGDPAGPVRLASDRLGPQAGAGGGPGGVRRRQRHLRPGRGTLGRHPRQDRAGRRRDLAALPSPWPRTSRAPASAPSRWPSSARPSAFPSRSRSSWRLSCSGRSACPASSRSPACWPLPRSRSSPGWCRRKPAARHGVEPVPFAHVLRDPELVRLNVGIFALHAILMALFVVVPLGPRACGAAGGRALVDVPGRRGHRASCSCCRSCAVRSIAVHERAVFLGAVAVLAVGLCVLAVASGQPCGCWPPALSSFSPPSTFLRPSFPRSCRRRRRRRRRERPPASIRAYSSSAPSSAPQPAAPSRSTSAPWPSSQPASRSLALWLAAAWPMGEPAAHAADPPEPHQPQESNP